MFLKLNVDASCDLSKKRTGLGVVIRNEFGRLVCASTEVIHGNISVYAAEACALLVGLRIYKKEGYSKVEVESDALNAIKTIESGNWEFSPEGHIFNEIKSLVVQLEEVTWRKNPRACNGVAHSLAKAAIPNVAIGFWKEVGLPWLEHLLSDDISS